MAILLFSLFKATPIRSYTSLLIFTAPEPDTRLTISAYSPPISIGMPKMNLPEMLSMMMGFPIELGWLMHFMRGIIFAMAYAFFFINFVKNLSNNILKGAIFGFAVFIFAQIMMAIMGMVFSMPPML